MSGSQKDLLLSQAEILNLSLALNSVRDRTFTLWYDGPDKKMSGIICLDKVAYIDVDDKDLVNHRDMELIDYKNRFRIWKEPSWFRKTLLSFKWFFQDIKRLLTGRNAKKGSTK
ncbi:Uncharacterised protein [uncultured archaeon]|nr:Uncharacterised protein [uncultured archaeon]